MDADNALWERVLRKLRIAYKKRATGVLVALCPFLHEEKTPSCHFWLSGRFRCHGCGLTGDVIFFVRRHQFGILDDSSQQEIEDFLSDLPGLPGPGQTDLPFPDP